MSVLTAFDVTATTTPSVPPRPWPGLFVTLEGVDGAGKSTHLARLVQTFAAQGHRVVQTREPGGTALGEQLRPLCLHTSMDWQTEALLMFAARREHIVQVIAPALLRGEVVISDRYTDATLAYQGYGRGVDLSYLHKLATAVQQVFVDTTARPAMGAKPDAAMISVAVQPQLTLWFDVDLDEAAERLALTRNPDRFECEQHDFFVRVQAGYAALCAAEPGRIQRIHASQSPEQVWQDIEQLLQSLNYVKSVPL